MFKVIRITVLLVLLLAVATSAWRSRATSVQWKYALPVNIYPINADGSAVANAYIHTLRAEDFAPIAHFMQAQAAHYGHGDQSPIDIRLGPAIEASPPPLPSAPSALSTLVWSLHMRWWAYWHGETQGRNTQVKLYLLYFDPATHPRLPHSTALQKGLLGRVNVFASPHMAAQNNVVITHEFLHTLGATDKYDLASLQPLFPQGYAEPQRQPLLPQTMAELMGGRIPKTPTEADIPPDLQHTRIGEASAREINWLTSPGS